MWSLNKYSYYPEMYDHQHHLVPIVLSEYTSLTDMNVKLNYIYLYSHMNM